MKHYTGNRHDIPIEVWSILQGTVAQLRQMYQPTTGNVIHVDFGGTRKEGDPA